VTLVLPLADLERRPGIALFEGAKHGDVELSVFVTSWAPGDGPGLHLHPYAEVFLVQSGEAAFVSGEDELVVGSGHVVVVPANTPHSFRCSGEERLEMTSVHPSGEPVQTWIEDRAAATRRQAVAKIQRAAQGGT
jgi:mannose-6-phosphate isomerase-like protein (cupin superfamily)